MRTTMTGSWLLSGCLALAACALGSGAAAAEAAPAPVPAAAPAATAPPAPGTPGPPAANPAIPPSPSTAPGLRLWPDPAFTHWPAIAYADEARNLAFSLPVKTAGAAGTIGWNGEKPLAFVLPSGADSISGLLPLPLTAGRHLATVVLDGKQFPLAVVLADAREAWPLAELRNGFPVDGSGTPVVLLDRRRDLREERLWPLLGGTADRPAARAWLVGDPLEAMGATLWDGLDAEAHPASDERYPQHAVLVALARLPAEAKGVPRTIVWSPGNQVLFGGAWSAEEERVLGLVRTRLEHLQVKPQLILALPPLPVDEHLRAQAAERRELLQRAANLLGWVVIDLAKAAGDPAQANLVAAGVYTRYPLREAQERMRTVLRDALSR
jgi:hypothetical protein